jgi:calpain-15
LASISALAEFPDRVENLFYIEKGADQVNASGIYAIFMFINGIKQVVIIDDQFPCLCVGGEVRPAFASSNDAELWVMLLEKAWAKLIGSYKRTEGGVPFWA